MARGISLSLLVGDFIEVELGQIGARQSFCAVLLVVEAVELVQKLSLDEGHKVAVDELSQRGNRLAFFKDSPVATCQLGAQLALDAAGSLAIRGPCGLANKLPFPLEF